MNDKLTALYKVIAETAHIVMQQSKVAYPKKQLFAKDKYLRTPGKRQKRQRARMMMAACTAIGGAQAAIIQSRPVPRNSFERGGLAIVGETGAELIEIDGKPGLVRRPVFLTKDQIIKP